MKLTNYCIASVFFWCIKPENPYFASYLRLEIKLLVCRVSFVLLILSAHQLFFIIFSIRTKDCYWKSCMVIACRSGACSRWGMGKWLAVLGAKGAIQGDGGRGLGRASPVVVIVSPPCFGVLTVAWLDYSLLCSSAQAGVGWRAIKFRMRLQIFLSFFVSWVSKTQPNHWTKRMASTWLAT